MSGRRERVASVLALALAALSSGCSQAGPAGIETVGGELDTARARWQAEGPDSYSYTLTRVCFCLDAGAARVVVEDGVVTSVTRVDTGERLMAESARYFPSVDGLFDVLEDAVARNAHSIEASFDPELGSPLRIRIDYVEMAVDEELGFDATMPVPLG